MVNHVALHNITHKDLKIDTSFQDQADLCVNITRIFPQEFLKAQTHYPLFFKKDTSTGEFYTVALLGLEKGENLFLKGGEWDANYIPLSIKRHPFVIGFQSLKEDGVPIRQPVIHMDLDSPRINKTLGEALFLVQGGYSEYLEDIKLTLNKIMQGHEDIRNLVKALVENNLLESVSLQFALNEAEKIQIIDLYTINEDRLKNLDDDTLTHLHRLGYLQDIYMIIASHANIAILLDKKMKCRGNNDQH